MSGADTAKKGSWPDLTGLLAEVHSTVCDVLSPKELNVNLMEPLPLIPIHRKHRETGPCPTRTPQRRDAVSTIGQSLKAEDPVSSPKTETEDGRRLYRIKAY